MPAFSPSTLNLDFYFSFSDKKLNGGQVKELGVSRRRKLANTESNFITRENSIINPGEMIRSISSA